MKNTKIKNKTIALSEIAILVIGIFAFVWLIGGIPTVNADLNGGGGGTDAACTSIGGTCTATSSSGTCTTNGKVGTVQKGLCWKTVNNYCCIPNPVTQNTTGKGSGYSLGNMITNYAPLGLQTYSTFFKTPATSPQEVVKSGSYVFGKYVPGTSTTAATSTMTVNDGAGGFWSSVGSGALQVLETAAVSTGIAYGFREATKALKGSTDQQNLAGVFGAGVGGSLYTLIFLGASNPIGWIVTGVLMVIFSFVKSTTEEGVVVFYCNQWQPVTGGANCDQCNHQTVPCSEYQCKSLGQSCGFVDSDPQNGGQPFCFYNNTNDFNPPQITANPNVLTIGYKYYNGSFTYPDTGVKLVYQTDPNGCISPFSKVTFGISLNEPGTCKVSYSAPSSYDDMTNYFDGSSVPGFNHTTTIKIPDINTTVGKNNQLSAYVRCQDQEGNANKANFVFRMCVQQGPDVTPPSIDGTNIKNDTSVAFGVMNASVDFYANEPANCKWSFTSGRPYDKMENNMTCQTDPKKINTVLDYTCSANLTGISQTKKTFYYVKCQDISPRQNTMMQDYVYDLQSSSALVINSASPNATTISSATNPTPVLLKATTIGGVYNGNAFCYYSKTGAEGSYTLFDNTSSYQHSTYVYVSTSSSNPTPETYYIRCNDNGGNADNVQLNFNVSVDTTPPMISRAYYENGEMKIVTDESATCEYSTFDCSYNFGEGTAEIPTSNNLMHLLAWNTASPLYIKCQDIYGNGPKTNECSIIVKALEKPTN